MSKTNPIHLEEVPDPPSNFIYGRIICEGDEQFCEVMTGHSKPEKTIVHSIPFKVGMFFNSQFGKNEIIEIMAFRKSKFKDERLKFWSRIRTK